MTVTRAEFERILERNGYPGAAENLHSGQDVWTACGYILDQEPHYNDGEELWMRDYIAGHNPNR